VWEGEDVIATGRRMMGATKVRTQSQARAPLPEQGETGAVLNAAVAHVPLAFLTVWLFLLLKPKDSAPGTIRGDFAVNMGRNIIHGSDGEKSAAHEIAYWFSESEIADWHPTISAWLYE
jgi:hypothetical protein